MLKYILPLVLTVVAAGCTRTPAPDDTTSPYAGQQIRTLKALSEQDVEAYLAGEGMGLAKAAELNHYPGPKHALALAGHLELTDKQRAETEVIYERMQAEAVQLGRKIVAKEEELDRLFAEQEAGRDRIRALTFDIGELQGTLRFVHLEAHLAMKALLTEDQVQRYDQLRGYDATTPPGQHPESMDQDHDGGAHDH